MIHRLPGYEYIGEHVHSASIFRDVSKLQAKHGLDVVVQNANAYEEGLTKQWRDELNDQLKNANRPGRRRNRRRPAPLLRWPTTSNGSNHMYVAGARDPSTMSPDGYTFDAAMLSRPGLDPIQDAIGNDYYTYVRLYPAWQKWLRTQQPPTLIVWGKGDPIF